MKWLLGLLLFGLVFSPPTYSQNNPSNSDRPSQPSIIELEPHKVLIIGQWRGFHEDVDFSMYYLYDFRADGTYLARHRAYEGEKSILDEFWQGKWNFDGKLVTLEGIRTKEKKPVLVQYKFNFADDNFLYYEEGSLIEPYIPQKIGKES